MINIHVLLRQKDESLEKRDLRDVLEFEISDRSLERKEAHNEIKYDLKLNGFSDKLLKIKDEKLQNLFIYSIQVFKPDSLPRLLGSEYKHNVKPEPIQDTVKYQFNRLIKDFPDLELINL